MPGSVAPAGRPRDPLIHGYGDAVASDQTPQEPPEHLPGSGPNGPGEPADGTRELPGDQTQELPSDQVPTGERPTDPDATGVLPGEPVPPAAWAGRARVRPPGPPGDRELTSTQEWAAPEEPGRRWWLPILVGVLGLVLLGTLGAGIWLIGQALTGDDPAPRSSPSGSPSATSSPSRSPTPATSAPPTGSPEPPTQSPEPPEPTSPPPPTPPATSAPPLPTTPAISPTGDGDRGGRRGG
jgi:hypothetical protein